MKFAPELISRLRSARDVAVLTGSGMSADSGVPTFRGPRNSLWENYAPEELATEGAFKRNPQLVWTWYEWRREIIRAARPNAGHLALARMQNHVLRLTLVTQNVDGLHTAAGNTGVIELHGNIMRNRCSRDETHPQMAESSSTPRCSSCGAHLRPDVVWFGEHLHTAGLETASAAAKRCEVFLCIGTSALINPAALLPVIALEHGAALVEINISDTPLTQFAHYPLKGSASRILPHLIEQTYGDQQ